MEDKRPLHSKKFIAFLVAEITWKILAGMVLIFGKGSMDSDTFIALVAIIITAGVVESGYILGQAGLDRYARMIEKGMEKKDS